MTALIIGSLNMDLVMRVARVPSAGETLLGTGFAICEGGKGANQAVACARLGAPVAMVGRTGQDGFGAQLRSALLRDGIDVTHLMTTPDVPTGVAMITVDAEGENRIILAPGANARLTPADIDAAAPAIRSAGFVVLQLEVPMATVAYAIEMAARAGAQVLLNPAPASALPAALWPAIDTLVPNESEAALLTGIAVNSAESAAAAAHILRARGVRQALITLGEQGVLIADAEGERLLPARRTVAIDTTAAGDCFIGALVAGLHRGMTLDDAAQLGVTAAGLCVTRPGAQPSLPYASELA